MRCKVQLCYNFDHIISKDIPVCSVLFCSVLCVFDVVTMLFWNINLFIHLNAKKTSGETDAQMLGCVFMCVCVCMFMRTGEYLSTVIII